MTDLATGLKEIVMLGSPTDTPSWDSRPRENQLACLALLTKASKLMTLYYIQYNMSKTMDTSGRYPKLVYPKLFKSNEAAWINMLLRKWPKGTRSAAVQSVQLERLEMLHRLLPGEEWAPAQPAPRSKADASSPVELDGKGKLKATRHLNIKV